MDREPQYSIPRRATPVRWLRENFTLQAFELVLVDDALFSQAREPLQQAGGVLDGTCGEATERCE